MFGLSLAKLLLTAAVIGLIWFVVRNRAAVVAAVRRALDAGAPRARGRESPAAVRDLTRCRACGDYRAAGGPRCGRADCPS